MQINNAVHNHNTDSTQCHQIAETHYIPHAYSANCSPLTDLTASALHNVLVNTLFFFSLLTLQYVGIRREYIQKLLDVFTSHIWYFLLRVRDVIQGFCFNSQKIDPPPKIKSGHIQSQWELKNRAVPWQES